MNDIHAAVRRAESLPVRFTASGSEYFRIWIANLLLTLLTLGLYHPWAKVRKLRYFYGNTWVGDHAFDFHGDPKRMLRGTLLVGAMFIAYSAAGQFDPSAGLIALAIVAGILPALFLASMRFRMANTSWRGMRFHFTGSMRGAYQALLPVLLPAALFFGFTLLIPEPDTAQAADAVGPPAWAMASMGVLVLATLALMPLMFWGLKRYQHGHYALGKVQSRLQAGPGAFYLLFLKTFGVTLLTTLVIAIAVVALSTVFGFASALGGGGLARGGSVVTIMVFVLMGIAGYIALLVVSNTFMASRLQNLVWSATRSAEVRFTSDLRLAPLMGLTLKNWLLIVLTLGLYWPFAAVASARIKLEAVTVHTRGSLDELTARAGRAGATDASGDAAGELFGLDVGL